LEKERDEARAEVVRLRAIKTAAKAWLAYGKDAINKPGVGWSWHTDDLWLLSEIIAGKGPGKEEE
jgi:hypothetical protein